jgi:hypothetical protein
MVKDPFDVALAEFERWTATTQRKLSADPIGELETLLPLMRGYLDIEGPGDLSEGDLDELLLRIYPRKVAVFDPADAEPTIPAVRDFLAFLTERGEMPQGTARALERELDLIAPRFTRTVMDPSNWGMASSLMHEMAVDGVDLDDQTAVDRWINDYHQGLTWSGDEEDEDEESIDLKEAFGLPDEMAPMRLPAVPELAAMARQAPMMGQLRRLAWWLGAGRAVNEDEELSEEDAAEAAVELGVNAERLEHLWLLALDTEFVELDEDETHAVPGEIAYAWDRGDDDDEVLDIWETVFALVIGTTLDVAADLDPDRSEDLDFSGHGAVLAVMLFLTRPEGLTVAEISEAIRGDATAELPPAQAEKAWQSWVGAHDDPARLLLGQMAELGAVQAADAEDGPLIRLTPLGLAAIRTQLVGSGVDIPLLPDAEQMTAAQLIAMADGASEEEFTAETTAWLSHRTAEPAARELLAVAAASDPASRILAVSVVITEIGARAEPVWREALGQTELRAYAKAALATLSGGDPAVPLPGLEPDGRDVAWMITDTLAAEGWDDLSDDASREPQALAKQLSEAIPAGQEMAIFELMARLPHPDAANVLTVIGRRHPDKQIAKLARKSAYKAATRQASQRR